MLTIALTILVLFFLIFSWYLWHIHRVPDQFQLTNEWPKVSVLLAARNEAANIGACLEALYKLKYPQEKLEVLIGNDRSEDQTRAIVESYIQDKPNFHLIDVTYDWGLAKSKGNVLAWLSNAATGDYYFITDADIRVSPYWIQGLLNGFRPGVGVVSGVSVVYGHTLFGRMQGLEWRYYMTLVRLTAEVYPITAIGNNMAVASQAYWDTNGYQHLEASVTEDYKLFQEITKRGWDANHVMNREVLGRSEPTTSLSVLLHQRKRWLRGGMALPKPILGLMLVHGLFVPTLVFLIFIAPCWALVAVLLQLVMQSSFLAMISRKLGLYWTYTDLILFGPYHYIMALITPLYFLLPVKLKWKNRDI